MKVSQSSFIIQLSLLSSCCILLVTSCPAAPTTGNNCTTYRWGATCQQCPGYTTLTNGQIHSCNSQNSGGCCSQGTQGTGTCTCANGYTGPACASPPLAVSVEMHMYSSWPVGFNKTNSAFHGGIYDGTFVWMIPLDATHVVRVHTADGTMQGYNGWPSVYTKSTNAFAGGVYDGTAVWLVPYSASLVVKFRTADGNMTAYNGWPSGFKKGLTAFSDGVYDGSSLWMFPFSADRVIQIRTADGTMQGYVLAFGIQQKHQCLPWRSL